MTSAARQVLALLALRWQMARGPGVRLAVCLAGLGAGWLLMLSLQAAGALEPAALETAAALAPEAFLGFAVLALIAPLTAAGGEVVPPEQLVAFPVRPQAQFLGGLLLAPLNLVWVVQLLVLGVEVSSLTLGGNLAAGALTAAVFVLFATVLGQALAWTLVGLRETRAGRRVALLAGAAVVATALAVVHSGAGQATLDHAPTRLVVRAVVAGGAGDLGTWAGVSAALLLATAVVALTGLRACAWALRRTGSTGAPGDARDLRRRRPRPSALRELVALDRASVWRAPALRRGGLVLALLPGVAAAGARVPWSSLAVLPGLVAAGSGLLFGINAFALDGSGATWLASLPVPPALVVRAKLLVLTETVLGAVVLAAVTGALRAPTGPTTAELVAVVAAALACTAVVVATGLHLSVAAPHRADLRGPRDAIAPPGALAVASVRLSLPTALTGLLVGAGGAGPWWLPPLLAAGPLALSAVSLRTSLRRWEDPVVRGRVVQVVARG